MKQSEAPYVMLAVACRLLVGAEKCAKHDAGAPTLVKPADDGISYSSQCV